MPRTWCRFQPQYHELWLGIFRDTFSSLFPFLLAPQVRDENIFRNSLCKVGFFKFTPQEYCSWRIYEGGCSHLISQTDFATVSRAFLPLWLHFLFISGFWGFFFLFFLLPPHIFKTISSIIFNCATWFHKNLNYHILSFLSCSVNLLRKLQFNIETLHLFIKYLLNGYFANTWVKER